MATKSKSSIPADILKVYEQLIKTIPSVDLKGATMPYTSHNGHMFSFLDKDGNLALRLPEKLRNDFINKFNTSLCEAHGTILKEYVSVPEKVFKSTPTLKKYFQQSFEYVNSMKPKPTKK